MQLGEYPAPTFAIAHLSDTHLLPGGRRQYRVVDTESGLTLALGRLARLDPAPDALVITGDLTDLGEPAAYRRLRELVEPAAAAMGATGAQVVWVMGNHDERAAYSRELFGEESEASQDRVYDVRGLRIVSLDTSVPGYHHGEVSDEQLAWLAEVLASPAEHGTVLAVHHPPIPLPMLRAGELIELADQERLADVLRGSDVRLILGGHVHFSTHSTFAGIPVSVSSASCYTADPAPLDRFLSGVDGHQAFSMSHLYADRVVSSVVPLGEAAEVLGYPADVVAQAEALSRAERRELISRKDSPFNAET